MSITHIKHCTNKVGTVYNDLPIQGWNEKKQLNSPQPTNWWSAYYHTFAPIQTKPRESRYDLDHWFFSCFCVTKLFHHKNYKAKKRYGETNDLLTSLNKKISGDTFPWDNYNRSRFAIVKAVFTYTSLQDTVSQIIFISIPMQIKKMKLIGSHNVIHWGSSSHSNWYRSLSPSLPSLHVFQGPQNCTDFNHEMKASLCHFCIINQRARRVWMYVKLASAKSFGGSLSVKG